MKQNMEQDQPEDLVLEKSRTNKELAYLFGNEIVDQAELIDIADLNINDEITNCITDGVVQLKKLRGKTDSQRTLIEKMTQGEKLVLCMWIMEMGLLEKLRAGSFKNN